MAFKGHRGPNNIKIQLSLRLGDLGTCQVWEHRGVGHLVFFGNWCFLGAAQSCRRSCRTPSPPPTPSPSLSSHQTPPHTLHAPPPNHSDQLAGLGVGPGGRGRSTPPDASTQWSACAPTPRTPPACYSRSDSPNSKMRGSNAERLVRYLWVLMWSLRLCHRGPSADAPWQILYAYLFHVILKLTGL